MHQPVYADEDLDAELAELPGIFTNVGAYLKRRINIRDSTIIQKLPPEIIVEILKFCIPPFAPFNPTIDNFLPFKLAGVCTLWRRTALRTPALWTCISILVTKTNINSMMALLEVWLWRSGTVLPLSIRLRATDADGWRVVSPGDILRVLARHSTQWLDLELSLPCRYTIYLPTGPNSLPTLSSLSIWSKEPAGTAHKCLKMANTPRLTRIALSRVHPIPTFIPWGKVTHLILDVFSVHDCLRILRETPQLVDGTFANLLKETKHPPPMEEPPVFLPVLKYLSIRNDGIYGLSYFAAIIADTSRFFRTIVTPNATDLCYTTSAVLNPYDVDYLDSLLYRSKCTLNTASFFCQEFNLVSIWGGLLRLLPSVTKLKLVAAQAMEPTYVVLTDYSLRQCQPSYRLHCLLPSLEHLVYTGPHSFRWPVLLDVLESRFMISPSQEHSLRGIRPIRHVELNLFGYTGPNELDIEFSARFRKLIEKGLRVDIRTTSNLALDEAGWKEVPSWDFF